MSDTLKSTAGIRKQLSSLSSISFQGLGIPIQSHALHNVVDYGVDPECEFFLEGENSVS